MDEDSFNASWSPVKAFLCKHIATGLLNKLYMTQAFHNGVDFNTAFAGKLTMVEDQAVI